MPLHKSSYSQIHYGERKIIERLVKEGYKPGKIARNIFRSRSTVWREIKRNGCELKDGSWHYDAMLAQIAHNMRQRGRKHSLIPNNSTLLREDNWRNGYKARKNYSPMHKRRDISNRFVNWNKYRSRGPVDATNYWAETFYAKRWRKHYNRIIRVRDYDREERYRPFRKSSYDKSQYDYRSPYAVYFGCSRYIPFLKRKSPRPIHIPSKDLLYSSEQPADRESPSFLLTEKPHRPRKRIHKKDKALAFLPDFLLLTPGFQKTQGITMSEDGCVHVFFKIPAVFHRESPRAFLKCG